MAASLFTGGSVPALAPINHVFQESSLAQMTSTSDINATGEMGAFCGRVWFPARTGTKTIEQVAFLFGTVVKAGGSALALSLQALATGSTTMRPSGTPLSTVAVANGDAAFATSTWYTSGLLSVPLVVSYNDTLAMVAEYDGGGRLGADTFRLAGVLPDPTVAKFGAITAFRTAAGAWSSQAAIPTIVLIFTDGTMGTLHGSFPCSALSTISYASDDATADEWAMELQLGRPFYLDGGQPVIGYSTTGANAQLVLYDGVSVHAFADLHAMQRAVGTTLRLQPMLFDDGSALCAASQVYRLALKPLTTAAITAQTIDVALASHWDFHVGGQAWCAASRKDGGAWTTHATKRLLVQPLLGGL